MFFVVKKSQIILSLLLVLAIVGAIFTAFASKDKNAALCTDFIKSLGYVSEKSPYEVSEIKIPEGFGKVYLNYNELQKQAGFDLTPYRGIVLTRYSFRLTDDYYTIANIFIYDGKICGGDILNPAPDGKMLPLIPKHKE